MEIKESDWLMHLGTPQMYDGDPHGSGRYRQGSGKDPYQHAKEFNDRVAAIKKEWREKHGEYIKDKVLTKYLFDLYGYGEPDGNGGMKPLTTRNYRALKTRTSAEEKAHQYLEAHKLKEKGWSSQKIGEKLGVPASTVDGYLKRDAISKSNRVTDTADLLRESLISKGGYIDIGKGSELWLRTSEGLGVSETTFKAAVKQLEDEGFAKVKYQQRQMFGQGNTTITVLGMPGTTAGEVFNNREAIRTPIDIQMDGKVKPDRLRPVESVSSKRIAVKYAEDGGTDRDGVIELRRGIKDLDLGNSMYAQVRIAVDKTHYLKGMAIYADDLPDGIDIRFNTNKSRGVPLIAKEPGGKEVLKPMNDIANKLNPFGAAIQTQRGALNIVNEEGDWSKWSRTLASQFLSKQYVQTAKKQLKLTGDIARDEFEEIKSLTNPTLKRYMLDEFARSCDADAVNLKAVRLPGQTQKVLLPLPNIKENQCYCPGYDDGTQVALVRYPHGGVFEIPVLTVNNNSRIAKKIMGNAQDAIGIHPKSAGILSGADFDGDTVMVLPIVGSFKPKTAKPLAGLKDFDPKTQFNGDHLAPKDLMKKKNVGNQMGRITNLITDMTVQGADEKELERAVAHSMVVIDAYKHKLDYKASEKYFRIDELRAKYQPAREEGKKPGAAGTIFSRAKNEQRVPERREKAVSKLTPEERKRWEKGEIIYEPTNKMIWNRETGKNDKPALIKTNQMREAKDAHKLTSGTQIEWYYAEYANRMKALANEARAEMRATERATWNRSAEKAYAKEVKSLEAKLKTAKMNAPLERKAQTLAGATVKIELDEHPEYDDSQKKKAKSRHLEAARNAVGAGKELIKINSKEWEAIQAGAISDSKALEIFKNSKSEVVKQMAMPRDYSISPAKLARAKSLYASGQTWADIATILGVSVTTLQRELS